MKKILLLLALAGCTSIDSKSVTWHRVSQEDLQRICKSYYSDKAHYRSGLSGCAVWYSQDNRCEIYTLDTIELYSNREQLTLGHELTHCFKGAWH